eukprot:TRINITY_DN34818_c0_g1_i1.p1 TRINITY_DN34818_c0_g1~~TRINITY_DN34818_c0_g1_i1.p1  ORF type:complete len:126 (+),score=23.14 TRINITY_DN34818_c0_g1_i1:40-378(+)
MTKASDNKVMMCNLSRGIIKLIATERKLISEDNMPKLKELIDNSLRLLGEGLRAISIVCTDVPHEELKQQTVISPTEYWMLRYTTSADVPTEEEACAFFDSLRVHLTRYVDL